MSYILDALRRADAERDRGAVPTLNAPAWTPATSRTHRRWWAGSLAIVLAAVLATLALLQWQGRFATERSQAQAPSASGAVASTSFAATASAALTTPAAAPAAPAPPQASAPVLRHVPPLPPTEGPKPGAAAAATPGAIAPNPTAASAAMGAATASAGNSAAAAPKASPSGPSRVGSVAELPEPQRSAVGRLSFGGGVHSVDRAQSFVLLGGQILREGEAVAGGITLERILPRSVLLRVDEQVVELKY